MGKTIQAINLILANKKADQKKKKSKKDGGDEEHCKTTLVICPLVAVVKHVSCGGMVWFEIWILDPLERGNRKVG